VAIANKLIEKDKVIGVVSGSYSGPTRVTARFFKRPASQWWRVMPYTRCDVGSRSEKSRMIFVSGMVFWVRLKEQRLQNFAVKNLKAKKISIISMDNDFGRSISAGFAVRAEKLGAQVLTKQMYKFPGEKDFRPFLTRIKEGNPDLIFAAGYYNEAASICRQAKELGIKSQIMVKKGSILPSSWRLQGPRRRVIIATNLDRDDPRPVVQNFPEELPPGL